MIKIEQSLLGISIQDFGRRGYAHFGVPQSGAMDQYAAGLANLLLGNPPETAVLEITFGATRLRFLEDQVIAIAGADFSAQLNATPIPLQKAIRVHKNDVLQFGKRRYGVRTYIALKQGIDSTKVLGSRSQYTGITPTALLKKNAVIPTKSTSIFDLKYSHIKIDKTHFTTIEIPCMLGPEYDSLNAEQQAALQNQNFYVSTHQSRMGYQLSPQVPNNLGSMLTSAVLPGTVQLTPSGTLIVLMRDCQATGGYPRVLQLSETGINRLAQKTTRDAIRFVFITTQ